MNIRVSRVLLTGAYHAELLQVLIGIDQYGARFGSQDDGVLRCHMTGLILSYTFALYHPEVRILTAVIKDKLVFAVERLQAVACCLTMHDGAQSLTVGCESDFIHVAKLHISVITGK